MGESQATHTYLYKTNFTLSELWTIINPALDLVAACESSWEYERDYREGCKVGKEVEKAQISL